MKARGIDSLDTVEMAMAFEEVFEIDIPLFDANSFASPREIVDRLEVHLSNERPNKAAQMLLRKLTRAEQPPELAEELNGPGRREQIEAIVREIFL